MAGRRTAGAFFLGLALLACSAAGAQESQRAYLPHVAREASPTPTMAPSPTPLARVENPPGLRVASFAYRPSPGFPVGFYRIENTGPETYYEPALAACARYAGYAGTPEPCDSSYPANLRMLRPGESTTRAVTWTCVVPPGCVGYTTGPIYARTAPGGSRYVRDGLRVHDVVSSPSTGTLGYACSVTNATGRDLTGLTIDFSARGPDGATVASDGQSVSGPFPAGTARRLAGTAYAVDPVPAGYAHSCVAEAREG